MKVQEDLAALTRQKTVRRKEQSTRASSQSSADFRTASPDTPVGPTRGKGARLAADLEQLRADFAAYVDESRQEMQRLSRRMQQLELLAKKRVRSEPAADPSRTPMSSARSLFTFLGRPTVAPLS